MTLLTDEQIVQHTTAFANEMRDQPGALLPILHRLQETLGYVPKAAVPVLAKALQLSRAEVHGVISFYHYFRTTPPGKHTVYVCRSEACQSMGGHQVATHAKKVLGVDWHQTTADQEYSLEPIYCLGNCACAPAVMIDTQVIGRVTPERLESLLEMDKS